MVGEGPPASSFNLITPAEDLCPRILSVSQHAVLFLFKDLFYFLCIDISVLEYLPA